MVPVIVLFSFFGPELFRLVLIKTGQETEATVQDYVSDRSVNDVSIYRIIYTYKGADDITYTGKTTAKYYYHELPAKDSTILIKYKGKNSINADATIKDFSFEILFLSLFTIVDTVLWVMVIKTFVTNLKNEKKRADIVNNGRETYGYYVDASIFSSVNSDLFYNMKYKYKDEQGKWHDVKTASIYSQKDIDFYNQIVRFKIKELNGKTTIVQPVDYSLLDKLIDEKAKRLEFINKNKICKHCRGISSKNTISCPNCGSVDFEDLEF